MLAADICDDFWFTRNLIMDRAGYCFGSALGQATFDNRDCTGTAVDLTPDQTRLVTELRASERALGCNVDTAQTRLGLEDLLIRENLIDLPHADEFESACIGWLGAEIPLYAGRNPDVPIIGAIMRGDTISFSHRSVDGWSYVTTRTPNWTLVSGGWTNAPMPHTICENWAG